MKQKLLRSIGFLTMLCLLFCLLPQIAPAAAHQTAQETEELFLPLQKPAPDLRQGEEEPAEIHSVCVTAPMELAPAPAFVPKQTTLASKAATPDLFGRQALAAKNMRFAQAYDVLAAAVQAGSTEVDIRAFELTSEEVSMLMDLYRRDHPEQYALNGGFSYTFNSSSKLVLTLSLTYATGFQADAFRTRAEELLSVTEGLTDELSIALALHDALILHVEYDRTHSGQNVHNAYGALVEQKAVCDGYSRAYQYLLQQKGIQAFMVSGESHGENHAWNLLRINGQYYYTDVTWDDPLFSDPDADKPIFYAYFNLPTKTILEDHVLHDPYAIYPVCTDENAMCPALVKMDAYTVEDVANAFRPVNGQKVGRLYFTGEQDSFDDWMSQNSGALFQKMQESGSIRYFTLSREHVIIFTPSQPASGRLTGSFSDFALGGETEFYLCPSTMSDAAIRHAWQTGTASANEMKPLGVRLTDGPADGGKERQHTFTTDSIPYGTYKILAAKEGKYLPFICEVSVHEVTVTVPAFRFWLYGDMNHNGVVETKDALLLLAYANHSENFETDSPLDKACRLTAMDVNQDGKLSTLDILQCISYQNHQESAFDSFR